MLRKILKRGSPRSRVCYFCQSKTWPDYKEAEVLRQFISERGRILSRSRTNICAKHQRKLAPAIKRARFLSLLPFIVQVK